MTTPRDKDQKDLSSLPNQPAGIPVRDVTRDDPFQPATSNTEADKAAKANEKIDREKADRVSNAVTDNQPKVEGTDARDFEPDFEPDFGGDEDEPTPPRKPKK